jgi:hypothetical protein
MALEAMGSERVSVTFSVRMGARMVTAENEERCGLALYVEDARSVD